MGRLGKELGPMHRTGPGEHSRLDVAGIPETSALSAVRERRLLLLPGTEQLQQT